MENASKALLIAGSILVVILLIAMGVRVFNSTSGTTDSAQGTMQTTEITMFNNKFLPYIGKNITANNVKGLANQIIAHNSTVGDDNKKVKLNFYDKATGAWCDSVYVNSISSAITQMDVNSRYKVIKTEYSAEGYIQCIQVRNMID